MNIKQLKWSQLAQYHLVETAVGQFQAAPRGPEGSPSSWLAMHDLRDDPTVLGNFETLAGAKASAQAYFEKLVKECLEPSPTIDTTSD